MILDCLEAADRYAMLVPGLAEGFSFLRDPELSTRTDGRYSIRGEEVFALVAADLSKGRSSARLEAHRRYLDIQYVLSGEEQFGWRARRDCREIAAPYDTSRDLEFFADPAQLWLPLPPGHFVIFFPSDAHAPLAGTGPVRKVVVKVACGERGKGER